MSAHTNDVEAEVGATDQGYAVNAETGEVLEDPEDEDVEEDGEEEPEPEPEPAARVRSEKELEAVAKKLDSEATRHANRISEIMGEDAQDLVPCPLCLPVTPGFLYNPQVAPVPPEQREMALTILGAGAEPEYVQDADYQPCGHCAGHGQTLSGATNDAHRLKLCDKCAGNGFVPATPAYANVAQFPGAAPATVAAGTAPVSYTPIVDQWERPAGHPHFGIPPAQVGS